MNSRAFARTVVVWLMVVALRVVGQGSDEGAWKFFTQAHSDGIGGLWLFSGTNSPTNILRITAFKNWSGVLMAVNDQGIATVSVDDYSWAGRGAWQGQLEGTNLVKLQNLFQQLASSTNSVPFWITNVPSLKFALPTNQLVLVGFREGTNWVQRQYSDGALPKAVFECYDLIIPGNFGIPSLNRGR